MGEKLKGSSKLKDANRPVTRRDRDRTKKQKLGLLTGKKRKMFSFRMENEFILLLDDMVKKYRKNFYHNISKTDIIQASLFFAAKLPFEEMIKILSDYGIRQE